MSMKVNGGEPQQPAKQPWKFNTYAGTQAGFFVVPSKTCSPANAFTALPYANGMLGVKAEKGNFSASAEVGMGTSATAQVKAGYEIPIGKHFGLELSADARIAQSMIGKDIKVVNISYSENIVDINTTWQSNQLPIPVSSQNEYTVLNYKQGSKAAGLNLMANYKPNDIVTFSAGARVSVVSGNAPNVSTDAAIEPYEYNINNNVANTSQHENYHLTGPSSFTTTVNVGETHTQTVVSPVVGINVKPDFWGKWDIGGEASFEGAKVKVAYNF